MKVDFTARRLRLSANVKDLFEAKLGKLQKILPRDAQAHVIVHAEKKGVAIEITVVGRQKTWTAAETGDSQETAAHAVLERIEAQAKKAKARVKEEKKHRGSRVRRPEAWESSDDGRERSAGSEPRRETITVHPMFEEDALTAFSGSDRDVLVFRDPTEDALRVLYRRRDGSLGLVIPG